jgi:hypothetical protein
LPAISRENKITATRKNRAWIANLRFWDLDLGNQYILEIVIQKGKANAGLPCLPSSVFDLMFYVTNG